ncbi:hypothetical protein ONZ43_g6731 [Nemania bipapillata]|uniref:Uncharacterized protein n=1 Tax=Nemania bipapillata TaxID=110536 RepID=A0ACC2HY66_9PEZI|nr:hypothetical protein ONZ43_g6731 [Nemania bipapillata]
MSNRPFARGSDLKTTKSNEQPQFTLTPNQHGQIPLLAQERKRYLELNQPIQSSSLLEARAMLQTYRAAFTRDLPELKFPSGQQQIDIVVEYLMMPCSPDIEESPTTQFVRQSHESLGAWKAYSDMTRSGDPRAYRQWNMAEARRRVRRHNTIISDLNAEWDAWVAEQSPEIQNAALRHPDRDEIQGLARSPFKNFYHFMLVSCDMEIQQRQHIAEALILQYPAAFPGFMTS